MGDDFILWLYKILSRYCSSFSVHNFADSFYCFMTDKEKEMERCEASAFGNIVGHYF